LYWYIFRSYYFALKIIFLILNKATQYISFVAITLFITFFLLIQQGLLIYEDIFINSLKGLYPEFITGSTELSKKLKGKYSKSNLNIKEEIFVHSEEIEFSYDGKDDITKFMNVRTYNSEYKSKLFDTLKISQKCDEKPNTIWLSSRLYNNMNQDNKFSQDKLFFKDEDDNYIQYPICVFELGNSEKWLLTSTKNAKNIEYMPFTKNIIYTDDTNIKNELYEMKELKNWKNYIDYDDLGLFLLAKNISSTFLATFFIFLITFMIISFSSLAKEFSISIFLTKLYGLNLYRSIVLYTFFFCIYTLAIAFSVVLEYNLIVYLIGTVTSFSIDFNVDIFISILEILVLIGFFVSLFISKKYHRLPL